MEIDRWRTDFDTSSGFNQFYRDSRPRDEPYLPVLALPFFLGYAMHLLTDSFTVEGIRPFWPFKSVSKGMLRVGGSIEQAIFIGFCIVDLVLLVSLFLK